jgi:succinate dehydrogenase assembly factor 1
MARSGIQRQVLALYRAVLREAARQPQPSKGAIQAYARHTLEQHRATVSKGDVMRIEHLLRQGGRQLERLRSPDFSGFSWRGAGGGQR